MERAIGRLPRQERPRPMSEAIKIGEFLITADMDGSFWIGKHTGTHAGEGMQTSREKLEKLISDFYEREF